MKNPEPEWRYERKYTVTGRTLDEVRFRVRSHSAVFVEAYPERYVNNVYFDTVVHSSYWSNLDGNAERAKIRVRWYGRNREADLVLERKIKQGHVGTKIHHPLGKVVLDPENPIPEILERTQEHSVLGGDRRATLLNRYCREYYVSSNRKYRLTLDREIQSWMVNGESLSPLFLSPREHFVVELKYAVDDEPGADSIVQELPFRITRHSKYVIGVSQFPAR